MAIKDRTKILNYYFYLIHKSQKLIASFYLSILI
jgi:hypothetical protein